MHTGRVGFPTEFLNKERSDVNLLAINSAKGTYEIRRFSDLVSLLGPDYVLVFNNSLTVRSGFTGYSEEMKAFLHFNMGYSRSGMIVEMRDEAKKLRAGSRLKLLDGSWIELTDRRKDFPRFWEISTSENFDIEFIRRSADYITYAHMPVKFGDEIYAGPYTRIPGSVEYPSASRPFTKELISILEKKGTGIETVTLHCNLSSLDASEFSDSNLLLEEYFEVKEDVAQSLNSAIAKGKKIIAVGTTVVRALESAWGKNGFMESAGFTNLFIRPDGKLHLDGVITGMHDPTTSHLLMLGTFTDFSIIRSAYQTAYEYDFKWHEFGDSCIIFS